MSSAVTLFSFIQPLDLLTVKIESESLELLPISLEHAPMIFEEFTSDITLYMFPKPANTIEETKAFIWESIKSMGASNNLQLVILKKDSKEFLGCCGLHGEENVHVPEFGIWLKKAAHGHGYGKEAITALYTWAEQAMNVDYYIYPVDYRNIASRKIPESLGGEVIREYVDESLAGNRLEQIVYKIPTGIKVQTRLPHLP
jgi:[ribosomal protein S5]-alanine N-acetyltransferase